MATQVHIERPRRWDNPLDTDMTERQIERILSVEPFASMNPEDFPKSAGLRDIVRNDMRIEPYADGDLVIREADYGTSAFLVMKGQVRVVLPPGLPHAMLGRAEVPRKGWFAALRQLWSNPRQPEVRDPSLYRPAAGSGTGERALETGRAHAFLHDVGEILDQNTTAVLGPGAMFGEIAALARVQRTTTIFAEGDAEILEIRGPGVREIRRRNDAFRRNLEALYRQNSLANHLRETPIFSGLAEDRIAAIADRTLFETYGDFDWHTSYKRSLTGSTDDRLAQEPVVVQQGDYLDGLLLVRSGFMRVSERINHGERTIRYLGRGAIFGLEEIHQHWRDGGERIGARYSLRAVGYADVLRVPTTLIEDHVLGGLAPDMIPRDVDPIARFATGEATVAGKEPEIETRILENLVENRYINGTATMLIDLDRCVRCDACVDACAKAHDNNPRFIRHGRIFEKYMVANACMHCADPVCMLGCPTGAIHRIPESGQVVINDNTCIGCASCATNCPYDNIRMVEIRDADGSFFLDRDTNKPILKATKCDLCVDQPGGPACKRACPYDALERVDFGEFGRLADWLNR